MDISSVSVTFILVGLLELLFEACLHILLFQCCRLTSHDSDCTSTPMTNSTSGISTSASNTESAVRRLAACSYVVTVDNTDEKVLSILGNRATPLSNMFDSDADYYVPAGMLTLRSLHKHRISVSIGGEAIFDGKYVSKISEMPERYDNCLRNMSLIYHCVMDRSSVCVYLSVCLSPSIA